MISSQFVELFLSSPSNVAALGYVERNLMLHFMKDFVLKSEELPDQINLDTLYVTS
jgi:hypothetical protein